MEYRPSDAQEAEAAARQFWRARASAAAVALESAVLRENAVLREQVAHLQAVNSALLASRALRTSALVKRVLRKPRRTQPTRDPAPTAADGPVFSIVMTVFNNGACLRAAIDSVVAQTLPDWEVVLWDDGTTDPETLAVLDGLDSPRMRVIRAANQGVVGARNAAARETRGEFLLFLDPDDELAPTYLEKALLTFTRFPSVDIVIPSVRVESESAQPFWLPAHFEERRIAYENTTPIASVIRRSVWEAAGGMSARMADGYEDWEFWRRCAGLGLRGWVLDDALLHYRHSETSGRDAQARKKKDELILRIKQLNPRITHPAAPIDPAPGAITTDLETRVFHIPQQHARSLVVFAPWVIQGGGADGFLKHTLRHLAEHMDIVLIGTQPVPTGHQSAVNDFLDITPYVYHLPGLAPEQDYAAVVRSLLYRVSEPAILNMGSPWAYEHLAQIRTWTRGFGPVVDIQFNHVGHLAELLDNLEHVDEVLVCSAHLRSLLVDYFGVEKPVNVFHAVPPPLQTPPPARREHPRTRVGWLGRNSPEKRPDLVTEIAAAAPDLDFLVAGGGFEHSVAQVPNLRMSGYIEDTVSFLAGCDVLLNTSDTEGISVSAMEALQLGVPVATRDVGGMSELIRDGENGFIYDPSDIPGLVRRLTDADTLASVTEVAREQRLPQVFGFQSMLDTIRAAVFRGVARD
ncbi:MAG TPA: glycosyltransferase [Actinomycetota bacterium]|nr:glycosyltransferase [Actinomycetota bacterium]